MPKLDEQTKIQLMTLPQVVGVGYGFKNVKGVQTDQEAVIVMVSKKLPPEQLTAHELVPEKVNDMPTDVIEVGELRALDVAILEPMPEGMLEPLQNRTEKIRPAPPGVSIGHYLITAGTFGAVVYDNSTVKSMILSNNHVLANATNGIDGAASVNDRVLQPGPIDFVHNDLGFSERPYIIGCLSRWVNLVEYPGINYVDCAIAEPLEESIIVPEILEIGLVQGVIAPTVGMEVKKSGRTTGLTTGQITMVNTMVDVIYGPGRILRFDGQIITTNMSAGGDSGSLLLDNNNFAVGLLFAGSSSLTVHNPIQTVLDSLSVNFG